MAKRNSKVSVFEKVWYPICAVIILWGFVYIVLGLISRFAKIDSLDSFCDGFKAMFKLGIQYWGAIIMAIGAVAGVVVMLVFAKNFDRVADREERRSARLSALKKADDKVVAEQKAEVVNEAPAEQAKSE